MIALLLNIFRLPQASTMAPKVDAIFDFILYISIFFFLLIVIGKIFFLFRYWRKKSEEHLTPYITGHTVAELSFAFILLILVMVIFYWGWVDYVKLRTAPADALEINVIAKQWLWEFQYAEGKRSINELVVPKGKPVKLIMTSQDVLHSFYVPNFRVKQDVLPKTYTSLWFEVKETGTHPVYCAEYCGTAHSKMLAKVKVVEWDDFEEWLVTGAEASAPGGKDLFTAKGCQACHSVDGTPGVGPTLQNIFGHEVALQSGEKAKVDENYLRESLMNPQAKVVKGFQPIMPTFQGQLKDEEVNALIGFIKSLK